MLIKMEEIRKSIGTAEGLGEKFSGADFISSANELLMLAQEALDMNNLGRFRLQPAVRGDHGALLLKITEKGHPESDYIDYRKYKKISRICLSIYIGNFLESLTIKRL